jgi:hypothetical protein
VKACFKNKIPETCWIPEEPHQGVYGCTIGAGRGLEIVQKFARFEFAAPHIGTDGDLAALQSFLLSFTMFRPSRLSIPAGTQHFANEVDAKATDLGLVRPKGDVWFGLVERIEFPSVVAEFEC